jgi:hypothetical protein
MSLSLEMDLSSYQVLSSLEKRAINSLAVIQKRDPVSEMHLTSDKLFLMFSTSSKPNSFPFPYIESLML